MDFLRRFKKLPSQSLDLNPPIFGVGAWSGHIPFAYDLVFRTQPSVIVELGVDRGESLLAFSDACQKWAPKCKIYGIDSWAGDSQTGQSSIHLFESVLSDIEKFDFKNTRLIRGRFESALDRFPNESIDILHIDGWHTYQAVKNDWKLFQPKVKTKGIILFHDSRAVAGSFGVYRLIDEIKDGFPTFEFPFFFGLYVFENSLRNRFSNDFLSKVSKDLTKWSAHYEQVIHYLSNQPGVHSSRIQNTITVSNEFVNETHYQDLKRHHTLSDVHLRQIDSTLIPESAEPNQAFTILTPVYEPDIGFLNAAAESVLSQSYEDWEWILINDGNTLEISTILNSLVSRDPRIRLVEKETNQHIASALNSGLEKASNQWCCVLDQDDLLTTDALSIASEYLQEYPQASIFYSDEDKTNAAGDRFCEPFFKPGYQPDLILAQNYLNHLTFFKAEEALTVSGFDDRFRGCQDWDFYLKIIELKGHNSVVHIPYVLYHWRQHTQSTAESITSKPYVLKNSLECIRKRTPDDTDLEQFPSGYIIRKFKNRVTDTLELGYQISEQFESKPVGSKKWLITGDAAGIIDEVSRFSKDYEDCVILLSPIEQSLSTDIQANLYGYADQEHVAFAAPQVYSTVSCSYENAYSISDQGFARTASDPIDFESEGYFMNLRLPTNPDVLNLSFSCFRARNWLKYESQIRERSLLQLSRAVADSSEYFLWVPHLIKMDRLDSLFELDDGDHKSIVPKRHWVSPYRRFFASGDETLNSTKWTGLRSDRHE